MELPDNLEITELDLSHKNLFECPDLSRFTKLITLNISYNQITLLDNLPTNLEILYCGNNQITKLDNLPFNLIKLKVVTSHLPLADADGVEPPVHLIVCPLPLILSPVGNPVPLL